MFVRSYGYTNLFESLSGLEAAIILVGVVNERKTFVCVFNLGLGTGFLELKKLVIVSLYKQHIHLELMKELRGLRVVVCGCVVVRGWVV